MTDTTKLREMIRERGLKLKFIAEKLGITTYGLKLKIENEHEFKPSEIVIMCDILDIKSLKVKEEIFFVKNDDEKSRTE